MHDAFLIFLMLCVCVCVCVNEYHLCLRKVNLMSVTRQKLIRTQLKFKRNATIIASTNNTVTMCRSQLFCLCAKKRSVIEI